MTDRALQNAETERNQLLKDKKDLQSRLRQIDSRLDRVEAFINVWHAFADGKLLDAIPRVDAVENEAKTRELRKPRNSKKEEVAEGARKIIRERGAAVSRKDLYEELTKRGYVIKGKDPEMVLSTMLWRMRDRVVHFKSGGYWLADEPYGPENYIPGAEFILETTDDQMPTA